MNIIFFSKNGWSKSTWTFHSPHISVPYWWYCYSDFKSRHPRKPSPAHGMGGERLHLDIADTTSTTASAASSATSSVPAFNELSMSLSRNLHLEGSSSSSLKRTVTHIITLLLNSLDPTWCKWKVCQTETWKERVGKRFSWRWLWPTCWKIKIC